MPECQAVVASARTVRSPIVGGDLRGWLSLRAVDRVPAPAADDQALSVKLS
jgi:hypothetical protein